MKIKNKQIKFERGSILLFLATVIFVGLTLIRYFSSSLLSRAGDNIILGVFSVVLMLIVELLYAPQKRTIGIIELGWVCILLLTLINRDLEYDYRRTLMCVIGILAFFWYRKYNSIKVMYVMIVAWAIATATFTWLSLFNYSYYIDTINKLYTAEMATEIARYVRRGMLPGLSNHYSTNTFYMISGVMVLLAYIYGKIQRREKVNKLYILSIIIMGYLLVTSLAVGKRGHIVFFIATAIIAYMSINVSLSKRVSQLLILIVVVLIAIPFVSQYLPESSNFFVRMFGEQGNSNYLTGRDTLYIDAIKLFLKNPLVGTGYGSFMVYRDFKNPGVHNDYIQFLCEGGIFGFMVCSFTYLGTIYKTYKLVKNNLKMTPKDNTVLMWSFIFQLFVTLYSLSGLPHYDYEIYMIYCIACAVPFALKKKYQRLNEYGEIV